MTRSWTHSLLASTAVLILVSAGCGGGDTAERTGGVSSAPAPPASATENQVNPMSRDRVQDGGKLTWPLGSMPPNFNYNQLDGTLLDTAHVLEALMPSLYINDAKGTPIWNPNYLAAEPTLVTEPKQVVTYRLNPKAKWADGTPITWEDLYWQWKASSGTDKAYQISSSSGYEDIEQVAKGRDDREVVVTFKHKYADWTAVFSLFYPASTNKSPQIFNDGWKERPLTTAGPFQLQGIDQTAKTITLVRNEGWWGDRAKLDTIVYRVIESDAQIDALANGEIDFMDVGPDANKYNRAKRITSADARVAGGPNFRHLTVNGTSPVLQDVRVRQALAMGINREAIARALLGPLELDVQTLNNHILMANQNGYQDNSGEVGTYNPTRAGQLLDEAGWRLNGKVRERDGKPLAINFVIPTGVATSRQEAELIQNMLAQIGATVTINTVPGNDFFSKYITPGQFDFTVFSWIGTPYPISSSKSIYAAPKKNPAGELDIQQNFARVGSAEIDRLFDAANQELDRTKALALANQIDALIWQEVHSLTTYQRPEIIVCKKNLANFGAFAFASRIYQDIGWAKP